MGALEGKTAIVTGAGRGLGRAIALEFAREGAAVVVASRTPATVSQVVEQIKGEGGEALGVNCDVGVATDIEMLVHQSLERFGAIDILVNNAQSFGSRADPRNLPRALEDYPEDAWDYIFDTGVKATFRLMKAVLPSTRAQGGGKIINFGSPAAQRGNEGMGAYNANKEAIRGLSRTAAREWGQYGINVNVISPTVPTSSGEAFRRNDAEGERLAKLQIPLRRFGLPTELGRVAVFLASADSDFITGVTVPVDGGRFSFAL
jgi:NAD(P)-dependent dehydrogenase (short-subunit alcohol dehydrogenase family)